jgi:hypothetical protein
MPTGYTAILNKGSQSFEDFVLQCAKAFGACIHQRDSAHREPPSKQNFDDYHLERIEEYLQKLKEVNALTAEEIVDIIKKDHAERLSSAENDLQRKREMLQRYNNMLISVKNWNPPSGDHLELKNFMTSQLVDSIKFDCNLKYELEEISRLRKGPLLSPEEYRNERIETINDSIKYHTEQYSEEQNRIKSQHDWIEALYNSLNLKYENV